MPPRRSRRTHTKQRRGLFSTRICPGRNLVLSLWDFLALALLAFKIRPTTASSHAFPVRVGILAPCWCPAVWVSTGCRFRNSSAKVVGGQSADSRSLTHCLLG